MNQKFEEKLLNFKPQFGNMRHIWIAEAVDKLRKKEKLLKEKLTNQAAIDRTLKEIENIEKHIEFAIENKN